MSERVHHVAGDYVGFESFEALAQHIDRKYGLDISDESNAQARAVLVVEIPARSVGLAVTTWFVTLLDEMGRSFSQR